jgi:hypothetical protein
MSVPLTPSTEATLDAEGRVAVDAPCVSCGYNLRTLKADALCPECAQPVSYSIQGYFLRFASPGWIRGLGNGLVLVIVALGGAVVVLPLISLVIAMPTIISASKNPALPPAGPGLFASVAQFVGQGLLVALAIVGLLRITHPDPAQTGRAEGITARRIIRLCCILLPIPTVVNLIAALCVRPLWGYSPGSTTLPAGFVRNMTTLAGIGFASGLFALVVYSITPLALLRHLAGLLHRLPRPGLVRFARVEFWGLLASGALSVLAFVVTAVTVLPGMGRLMAAAATMPSTSMPSTAPGGNVSMTYYSVAINQRPGRPVSVVHGPLVTTTATVPTSAPATSGPPSALGYVAPTTNLATSLPTSMPGMPPSFFSTMLLVGSATAVSGCAGLGFGIAGVVLLIMSASAFYKAAREAEGNAGEAPPKSSGTAL